ncbi:hypothetical protein G6F64_001073 [Rhizopus arrhizus]|uniref:F-box domain-containing protein n=1 Tax=Rhizopus oryzae TaxID=64495 RepID=A0A9P7BXM2_RHIOR|nr:hypothetical protein G6F64_001073 [Rhizopus arrhizus]
MYTLSTLPREILYIIATFLDIQDLVTVARLNNWYGYWLSCILSERMKELVEKEGWRIHIDILATSHPSTQDNTPSIAFSTELLLLSEFCRVNPVTLTLEFLLCPIDDDGLDAVKNAPISTRSLVMFNKVTTNINIVAYFAQISPKKRLQHINQAGSALINDLVLWRKLSDDSHSHGVACMRSGFRLSYELSTESEDTEIVKVVDQFKNDYDQHQSTEGLEEKVPLVISFDKVYVSPEWWIKQMEVPMYSSNDPQDYLVHGLW